MGIQDEPWAAERGPKTRGSGCKYGVIGLVLLFGLTPCLGILLFTSARVRSEPIPWRLDDETLENLVAPFFEQRIVEFYGRGQDWKPGTCSTSWQGQHWSQARQFQGQRGLVEVQVHLELDGSSHEILLREAWLEVNNGNTYDLLDDPNIRTPGLIRLGVR